MNKTSSKSKQKEKSQYAFFSYNLFNAREGTLSLSHGHLLFKDMSGETLVDIPVEQITKYKQRFIMLHIFTQAGRYKFTFIPGNNPKQFRKNALFLALRSGTAMLSAREQMTSDSKIMTWVRALDKLGVRNGRRNSFAYSLLFVIFPILIFTSLALYGNIAGLNATSVPRSYTELVFELIIVGTCFAGFAYVFKTIRKNNAK